MLAEFEDLGVQLRSATVKGVREEKGGEGDNAIKIKRGILIDRKVVEVQKFPKVRVGQGNENDNDNSGNRTASLLEDEELENLKNQYFFDSNELLKEELE